MYILIPYKQFKNEYLLFKNKRKKEKEYIKLIYKIKDIMINDIYIMSPEIICENPVQCYNAKLKNKFMIYFKCPPEFIEFITGVENTIQLYIENNTENNRCHTSIIRNNIIKLNIYKDIYTGISLYDIKNENAFDIETFKKDMKVKLILSFNYIWINNYNYGISWRITGVEKV